MSTGTLKKPSRPPPLPPKDNLYNTRDRSSITHYPSNSTSPGVTFGSYKRSTSRLSDYIRISDCHTGLPGNKHHSSNSYSNKISCYNHHHHHHHDSKTLCVDQICCKQQQVANRISSVAMLPPTTVYKTVDFIKTEALAKCQVERTRGRGSDSSWLLVSSNQRKS